MDKLAADPIWVNNTDYKNVGSLLNTLVGLGLLAGGAGMTARGVQSLRNRVTELPIAVTRRPSRFVQKQDRLRKILFDPKYTNSANDEDADTAKSASVKVAGYCNLLEKQADGIWEGLSSLMPWNWVGNLEAGAGAAGKGFGEWLQDSLAGTTTVDVNDPEIRKRYSEIPGNASFGQRIQAHLATKPGLRSLWFLPGATAALGLGYVGGDQLMSKLDDLLGSAKMRSDYKDKAEKIYQKSVKYLQDVAAGRIKRDVAEDERDQVKESSFIKRADPKYVSTGSGNSGFILHPNFLLALVLAGLTARQIKGGLRGYDTAKRELADRTHLHRAFQAARREREGDYNGLHLEMDPEPSLTPYDKSLARKSRKLISDTEKNTDPMLRYENYQMERIRNKQNSLW